MPAMTGRSRPWTDHRLVVEGIALRARASPRCPRRADQVANRRNKPGRPIDFGREQETCYRGRNLVECCVNKLKQWRGIAMCPDKTARSYRAAIGLSATLIWITDLINTD